ncbi:MAG: [protein-PII] uridylyltransferase [Gammaproteobacteria bacterium]|nr:[protein-PII] uridylyltransferase [Gammaproteobacteria bacterium]
MTTRVGKDEVFNAAKFEHALRETADVPSTLAAFRTTLRDGREALKRHYLSHPRQATHIIALHASLVDELLIRAWQHHQSLLPAHAALSLIAVGGYGRGELHPGSDVDILLLLKKAGANDVLMFAETFVRFLWDIGLEIGHSVRTLKECTQQAKGDVTIATNLMETRLLVGDAALFQQLRVATHPKKIWPSNKFFAAKREEQRERHLRFDDTAYNLEPNIKEGPGGLRDIQMISWVTQRHFDTQSLHELVEHGFLHEPEYRALVRGRDFLWQVRCGLHYLAGRREERLLFDHQRALAKLFGYVDQDGALAVEQFMKRYYRAIKELSLLNVILLQHFEEAILTRGRAKIEPINRRFQSHNGFLEVRNTRVFQYSPYALLELFHLMQLHPQLKGVRANTIRLVRTNLHRINASFRRDIACRSLFMEILRQPAGITHELRRMNAYGVLGRYIPAFGRVVGQMQHDLFHVYTVDQHSLFVVRNLRRFTIAQHQHEFPLASSIIQTLTKPERLYLGGLFHDIAKGRGGDHSVLGEQEAEHFCQQHGMSEYDTHFVMWLVRHHLIMSDTAQRQDIMDPEVVRRFAERVGDKEHLDNLYLLTVADMRGTSPKVWNVWKGRLLSMLYHATLHELHRGVGQPLDHEARVNDLRADVMRRLTDKKIAANLVEEHWQRMDIDYFLRHEADSLAWHTEMITRASASELPLVAVRHHPEAGGTEILVYGPDRDGLFVDLTAGIDRLNLSIWDARIHTTRFGFALDTFVVLDHANQPIAEPAQLARIQTAMREQLLNPRPGRDLHHAHLSRALKHFPIRTHVAFDVSVNGQTTVMEVTAQDRPGLLYQVALALAACNVRLVTAKVATFGERVEDIFYVVTRDGRLVSDPAQQQHLATEIGQRLDPPVEQVQAAM